MPPISKPDNGMVPNDANDPKATSDVGKDFDPLTRYSPHPSDLAATGLHAPWVPRRTHLIRGLPSHGRKSEGVIYRAML